jgi:GNAT superfamily N-acetyltransferase
MNSNPPADERLSLVAPREQEAVSGRVVIRRPTYGDIPVLIQLGADMHDESAYAFLPYDRAKVQALIVQYVEDSDSRCGLVAESGGCVIGMIGGVAMSYYFCDETLVADEVLFVTPDRRGGTAAARLIAGLQEWAADRGARELCLSVSTRVQSERTAKFYERLGFSHVGGIFKKRLVLGDG